ncbi:hypothetical protein TELCIR_00824 [Teladorsagia circumcincta]|uniref:DDT domain-containing protein n=1 Tax=Teladorsagia circumcincta TaxID=45464 RepID=A0A2G9V3Q2_TELCI|nr:hypothetical protein TELCIR_00824 [Teladorsagia circumcincta]
MDVEKCSTIANCGTGTVDEESITAAPSVESTMDDADGNVDDVDMSDGDQPGPAGIIRKPSAAPQIDAEQLRCDPDFAVICSFINKFFTLMKMEPVSFCQLENMFTTLEDGRVSKELVDLHLKLLRRSIVKTIPTALRAMDMRDMVTGVDKNGLAYYCQIDSKYGLRLYTTEQDDESGYSWTLVARDMPDLENLIAKLKDEDLGYVKNPNDKREFNKPAEGDAEPSINMVTKKGTYVDVFLDEAAIKKMREAMIKEKEERRTRRNARLDNPSEPQEELVPEEEEKPVENEEDSSSPASDDSDGSAGTSDAEGDGSATSDDEFKPKTPKKSTGKRRHKKKKIVEDVDDDDESADEDEEEVRRRAEGDFACGSCKLSDNEDIVRFRSFFCHVAHICKNI